MYTNILGSKILIQVIMSQICSHSVLDNSMDMLICFCVHHLIFMLSMTQHAMGDGGMVFISFLGLYNQGFHLLKNPNNLDPSCKMALDFWVCFSEGKPYLKAET